MRFLISSFPFAGHFNPIQPIVKELVRRGHEVLWITGRDYEARVTSLGADFYPMSEEALIHDYEDWEPVRGSTGFSALSAVLRRVFIDRIVPRVRDYQAAVKTFPADLLLVDFRPAGAHTFCDLTGIPYATLGVNPLVTPDSEVPPWGTRELPPRTPVGRLWNALRHSLGNWLVHGKLIAALNERRVELGLPRLPPNTSFYRIMQSDMLHIMMTTPAFEFPRAHFRPSVKFVGPLLPSDDDIRFVPPPWWKDLLAHPRERVVHVTQSTVHAEDASLIESAVLALADRCDLLVVVTGGGAANIFKGCEHHGSIGEGDVAKMHKPANVRVAPFIPHPKLLPHVGVMVTNAGYNGVLTALACGVPIVCAGRTEDKPDVSSRIAWVGAGVDLRTDKPTVSALRKAVLEVLAEPRYHEAARRIQIDFAKHNGAVEAANELERAVKRVEAHRETSTINRVDGEGRMLRCSQTLHKGGNTGQRRTRGSS
ncbi:Mgt family [Pleurostoma richardsiae]|uniref:Mgt family n=1 Tax=Pleurostoma richardsiae TaxID=41990 RepID=A0AA38R5R2_9PEZI|nr:Mgt family [Pleurostoma richardsiae]